MPLSKRTPCPIMHHDEWSLTLTGCDFFFVGCIREDPGKPPPSARTGRCYLMTTDKGRMCDTPNENLNDYPLLKNLLPVDYIHHVCSYECLGDTNFRADLKVKLSEEEDLQKWLEDFTKSSGLTWRKSKTYPDVGHGSNKYRVDLRCQHNTRQPTPKKTTKNTACRATMFLILKRQAYSKVRKSRSEDPHIKEGYYFNVNLRNDHNHLVSCAEALQKRDVSRDTRDKLKTLFKNGHSPSSALDTIKYDLREQEGENYIYAAADRSVCPDIFVGCIREAPGKPPPSARTDHCYLMTTDKGRMCDTPNENLNDYPLLKNLLPVDYIHHVCSYECLGDTNFRADLKVKLSEEEDLQKWLEDFTKSSGLTWRKSKTYPDVGHGSNKYRVDLRCQHNTRQATPKKTTKNTACRATMFLILKRQAYSKGRKSRSEDPHIKEGYYFNVNLRNDHNHLASCAEALQKRDVSRDTRDKLKTLFENGHSPSSALDAIKYDLREQEGENYIYAAADRSVCPDIQFCYRLYYKLFQKAGRPTKASRREHPYQRTRRKTSAPHGLAHCVDANMSLGGTH